MKSVPRFERLAPWAPYKVDAGAMFTRCRAAAVSIRSRRWEKAANADKMEVFFRKAAREQACLTDNRPGLP